MPPTRPTRHEQRSQTTFTCLRVLFDVNFGLMVLVSAHLTSITNPQQNYFY